MSAKPLPPPFKDQSTVQFSVGSDLAQGKIVSSEESKKIANRINVQMTTITPSKYSSGKTITIDGVDYPILSVTKSTLKTNSGTPVFQKSADIQLPESESAPIKKYSFLIVKSF